MNPFWNRSSACPEALDAYGAKKAYTGEKRVAVIAYDPTSPRWLRRTRIIGNRTSVTNSGDVTSYSPNNLNQYSQRQMSEMINLRGSAETGATVTVKMGSSQSESVTRQEKYWHKQLTSTNDTEAQYPLIKVVGVAKNAATNGNDIVTIETGHVFVAKTPEQFTYDEDGNLLSDGRFSYSWDAENRIVSAETMTNLPASVPRVKVDFTYDYMSRRVEKTVSEWVSNDWSEVETTLNVFNGWDLLQELQSTASGLQTNYYVHGLDLSGTLTGAGGIGGLVAAVLETNTCYYTYCANGNVSELVDTDGNTKAHYEYSPYGKTLVATGALADENKFRFSTKPVEENTGLVLYEYRIYLADLGRFGSRDPIGEDGGIPLYVFTYNNMNYWIDRLGLAAQPWRSVTPDSWDHDPCSGNYGTFKWRPTYSLECNGKVGQGDSSARILFYWYNTAIGADTATAKVCEKQHYDNAKAFYENSVMVVVNDHDGKVYDSECDCEHNAVVGEYVIDEAFGAYIGGEEALEVRHREIAARIKARHCP